jgi:hypothetical protein
LEKQVVACFIQTGNPFGTAGATGDLSEESNEGLTVGQRLARNQALVRGAPVVQRSLTAVGTSLVASGIAMSRKPIATKQFSSVALHDRARSLKVQRPDTWRKDLRAERKRTRYYRSRAQPNILGSKRFAPDPFAQKQYWERRAAKKQRRAAVRRGAAGGALMTAGRLAPTAAYAIVLSSYLSYDGYGNIPTGVNTERVVSDVEYLVERQRAMIDYGRSRAADTYAAYKALDMIWGAVT